MKFYISCLWILLLHTCLSTPAILFIPSQKVHLLCPVLVVTRAQLLSPTVWILV